MINTSHGRNKRCMDKGHRFTVVNSFSELTIFFLFSGFLSIKLLFILWMCQYISRYCEILMSCILNTRDLLVFELRREDGV